MGAAPQLQDRDVIVAFDLAHADRTPELGGPVEIANGQDGMADPHGRTMLHRLEVSHFVAGAEQLRVTPGRPSMGGRPPRRYTRPRENWGDSRSTGAVSRRTCRASSLRRKITNSG